MPVSTPQAPLAQNVRWNLSDLYASPNDPKLMQDLKNAQDKSKSFEKKYKALFASSSLSAPQLSQLLGDYKEIITLMTRPGVYTYLHFAEQTNESARGAFLQKIQTELTDISSHLAFFDVEWNKLPEDQVRPLYKDPSIQPDEHLLQKMRTWAPHTLKEGEEIIMAIKSNTSGAAFSRLFDETINRIVFTIELNGTKETKTEGEILSLLHSPDRSIRKKASESLAKGLSDHSHVLTYIFNMILADHRSSLKIRHYQNPMDARNLSNEMTLASVKHLVESVKKSYPMAQRYYALKTKLLGLPKMLDYDRYAPIEESGETISFEQCQKIVLDGYNEFSKEAGKIAEMFFVHQWIDAEIRPGKQGGGFCCQTTPDLHPYILVNYTGSIRDVMTVAHEIGHGIHQYLSRKAGILESDAPLTLAECASVFGEMLIFEKLLQREKDPKKQLSLICGKIDDNFATVFRQIVLTDFEIRTHEEGLKNGELSTERLSEIWIECNAQLYGASVELSESYRSGWQYIGHFIHSPFYCYAYAFAQLFVLCLYQRYQEQKSSFVPNYFKMLELGGSKSPAFTASVVGLDLTDEGFWSNGLSILDHWVTKAETIAKGTT